MGSSKRGPDTNRSITDQTRNLHQRLVQVLNLGTTRPHERYGRRWQCTDIQIQKQVVRLISAFLDNVSQVMLHDPLLKGSIPDMLEALLWILKCKNEVTFSMAADATTKLVSILPSSILEAHVLDLISPLSSLLSYHQTEITTTSAKALTRTLSNTTIVNEKEVWDVLKRTNCIRCAIDNILSFSRGTKPIEYFKQMVSLLSTVLQRWPPSRFSVWNDSLLMQTLYGALLNSDSDPFVKAEVLKLLSAIALCGNGAMRLLEKGEALLEVMVQCMDSSQPHSVRMEGFKLAQCLVIIEQNFFKMISFCCEPFIRAIVFGMRKRQMKSRKVVNEWISLATEAFSLALIARWGGKHHKFFWKHGIDEVLLDLLLENSQKQLHENSMPLGVQISIARESLDSNCSVVMRDRIWHILGCLAIHCDEDFYHERHQNKLSMSMLITCACVAFVDTVSKRVCYSLQGESAIRVVLLMIYSPCTYIASNARFILSEVLKPNGKLILTQLLSTLEDIPSMKSFDRLQIMIYMMALTCYIGLPEFQRWVLQHSGVKILYTLERWCLSNDVNVGSLGRTLYLHNPFLGRNSCCISSEDWEGKDIIAICSLWGLAELIKHSARINNNQEISSGQMTVSVQELPNNLRDICIYTSAPGVRWFATYALSSLRLYGFPSKLGNRIGEALRDKYLPDTRLILSNGEGLSVHGVILAVRCPSLLPPEELHFSEETSDSLVPSSTGMDEKFQKEIRLSAHVDRQALSKLLDFVYFGYLQAEEEELVKKLRTLSKRCNLPPLMQMLCGKIPKWNAPFPSYDLSLALGPVGHRFSDIILQAKANESLGSTCDVCSASVPHMHVHKVILASRCSYMRALFDSGMMESLLNTIKVDISWEALVKIVTWFYSDVLPNPTSGCLWKNMSVEEKLHELQSYVEVCWLADYWCLENVQEAWSNLLVSRLDSCHSLRKLPVKIMQFATSLSMENIVQVAATCAAPFFRELCESGELEDVDDVIVARIRTASVELSRERTL